MKDWSDQAERISLNRSIVKDARRQFSCLTSTEAMEVATRLIEMRRVEWITAYPDVVSVSAGYRSKRRGAAGTPALLRQVCVIFVVRRKRKPSAGGRWLLLPPFVMSETVVDGQQVLVAVPTDVVDARESAGAVAEGFADGLYVRRGSSAAQYGSACCVVRLEDAGRKANGRFLLGCRHVFNPAGTPLNNSPKPGATVYRGREGDSFAGNSTSIGGVIWSGEGKISFDAQLAETQNSDWLASYYLSVDQIFSSRDDFVERDRMYDCEVLVPSVALNRQFRSRHPGRKRPKVYARFQRYRYADQPIYYPTFSRRLSHQELLELKVYRPGTRPNGVWATYPGDSGSPVIMNCDGEIWLVGMHIAGVGSHTNLADPRRSIVLPAWALFNHYNYPELVDKGLMMRPEFNQNG